MDFSNPLNGDPFQPIPMFVPGQTNRRWTTEAQQFSNPPTVQMEQEGRQRFGVHRGNGGNERSGRKRTRQHRRGGTVQPQTSNLSGNIERFVDNVITNPAFWSTVFSTLQNNTAIAEEIRRDLEQQEILVAEARSKFQRRKVGLDHSTVSEEINHHEDENDTIPPEEVVTEQHGSDGTSQTESNENNSDEVLERNARSELPDLYEIMSKGFVNTDRISANGVQRLDILMEELDIEALWSERDVMISFGALTRVMLRLFSGPYSTEEENLIVRMINLGVERAFETIGFDDYRLGVKRPTQEPFVVTYRRRSRVLRDFAAFRYMLEVAETMGRIGRKHKNDLLLLYLTLTTPEVRLHRRMNAADRENVLAFRDCVTGFTIPTPPIMGKPMSIEMHLDSVFGNVSTNSRLLERSLAAALNNRHRKPAGMSAAREVETLLENAQLLDIKTDKPKTALRHYAFDRNEHLALRHMLDMSVVVSMMAEEFRVFIAGAPPSRCSDGAAAETVKVTDTRSCKNKSVEKKRPYMFRRPIFFTFKPTSRAVANC